MWKFMILFFLTSKVVGALETVNILNPSLKVSSKQVLKFQIVHNNMPIKLSKLKMNHGRRLHALLIPSDLNSIAHVHPFDIKSASKSTTIMIPAHFKHAGNYTLVLNYTIQKKNYSIQKIISVVGKINDRFVAAPVNKKVSLLIPFHSLKFKGHDKFPEFIQFNDSINIKTEGHFYMNKLKMHGTCLSFQYFHVDEGKVKPVDNLSPYLSMAAHVTIVKEDMSFVGHFHGSHLPCVDQSMEHPVGPMPSKFGSYVYVKLPDIKSQGFHRLIIQVARQTELLTTFFGINF